uniref:Uncharacterized protein n=1 Tax=Pseudonaja textilis TaxID=8673 RepID=A0A670Z7C9_PSETE
VALEGLRVNSGISADPPVVTVSSRTEVEDGMETHVCRLDGFYPREIDASRTRDGEAWEKDTFHGPVVSNADGTYHYWLIHRPAWPSKEKAVLWEPRSSGEAAVRGREE